MGFKMYKYGKILAIFLGSHFAYGQFPNNHTTIVNDGKLTSTKEITLSSNKYENCYLTGFTGSTPVYVNVGANLMPSSIGWKMTASIRDYHKIKNSTIKASAYCQKISHSIWNKNGSDKSRFYKMHRISTKHGKPNLESGIDFVKVKLGPIENQFCWLSGFKGTFHGASEEAVVFQQEGYWWASVKRYDHKKTLKMHAVATCAPSNSLPEQTVYNWRQEQKGPQILKPARTHTCFLMGIRGNFQGWGESLFVGINDEGDWYLDGTSAQEGVLGYAACQDNANMPKVDVGTANAPPISGKDLYFNSKISKTQLEQNISIENDERSNSLYCPSIRVEGSFMDGSVEYLNINFGFISSSSKSSKLVTAKDFGKEGVEFSPDKAIKHVKNRCIKMDFEWACNRINTPDLFSNPERKTLEKISILGGNYKKGLIESQLNEGSDYDFHSETVCRDIKIGLENYIKNTGGKLELRYDELEDVLPLLLIDNINTYRLEGNDFYNQEFLKANRKNKNSRIFF